MTERTKKTRDRKKPFPRVEKYHQQNPIHRKSHAGTEILLLALIVICLIVLLGFFLRG